MAKTFNWFGTGNDARLIVEWLKNAGAVLVGRNSIDISDATNGEELVLHFPSIGPIELWPAEITLPPVGDGSPRAKSTILAAIRQQENPRRAQIDVDKSAVAGLKLPEFRDGRYWVGAQVWFPTALLKQKFPELHRICQRLERFLGKFPTVFDNRKGEDQVGFGYQLCTSGIVQKIVALPEAFELLQNGAFMIGSLTSPYQYAQFRRRLQLSGHENAG
jgi:hypothetical protein